MAAGSSYTSSMHSIAAQSDLSHALWTYALATSRGGTPQSVLEGVEDANVAPATLFGILIGCRAEFTISSGEVA